jgi:hypothetical protein
LLPWHSKHDRGRLILGNSERANLFHLQHSARAVAHASQNHTDGVLPGIARSRAKKDIDGGMVTTDERSILYFNVVSGPASLQKKMMVSGSNQSAAAEHSIIGFRLFNADCKEAIEACGKGRREEFGHMLNDDNSP